MFLSYGIAFIIFKYYATNNPVVSVQKELEELKTYFGPFVEKAKKELSIHLRIEYDEKLHGLRYNKEVLMHTIESRLIHQ